VTCPEEPPRLKWSHLGNSLEPASKVRGVPFEEGLNRNSHEAENDLPRKNSRLSNRVVRRWVCRKRPMLAHSCSLKRIARLKILPEIVGIAVGLE
jgi:hypothetical protein